MNERERLSQQCSDLLEYMQLHPVFITHRTAEDELGIMRLAARICDLKKAKHVFEQEWIEFTARNGRTGKMMGYRLVA